MKNSVAFHANRYGLVLFVVTLFIDAIKSFVKERIVSIIRVQNILCSRINKAYHIIMSGQNRDSIENVR